jgi:hypothetical protein
MFKAKTYIEDFVQIDSKRIKKTSKEKLLF